MRLRKPPQEVVEVAEVVELTNVAVRLLEAFPLGNHYALAHVDPLGVIERLKFADVEREVARWADLVRERGVEPRDRVVVLAGRDRQWRCALLGVLQAGGVAVPCPASTPVADIRAIASRAGAVLYASARARPDLVEPAGIPVLAADELDPYAASRPTDQPPHMALPDDIALILYARDASGLHGAMHTHDSLLAQAEAGKHWLGVGEDERVWCTAPDGSAASIWVLLAAWSARAAIVDVEYALDPEAELELLDRFKPAAVWFTDDEYAMLASAEDPGWVDLGSISRALTSEESADGATAFQQAFGAEIEPVYGSKETGVVAAWSPLPGIRLAIVDEQGNEVAAGQAGDVAVRGDTPSLFVGYDGARVRVPRPDEWFRVGGRGALEADGSLRLVSRALREIDPVELEAVDEGGPPAVDVSGPDRLPAIDERRRREEAESRELAERAAANERRRVEEAERSEREAELAVQRILAENAKRTAEEAARAEKQRLADEERRRVEDEKRRAEEAKRAEREAARAEKQRLVDEKRRRAEDEKRRAEEATSAEREAARAEQQRLAAEERRRSEEEKRRAEDDKRREKERRREAAEQAERERLAAEAAARQAEEERQRAEKQRREEERREKQQASERQKVEERRRREEAKSRKLAERAATKERRLAEKAERAEREAARAEERRRAEGEKRSERERSREAAEQAERDRLAPDILARISQYGMTAPPVDPDGRRNPEELSQSGRTAQRDEHRHTV